MANDAFARFLVAPLDPNCGAGPSRISGDVDAAISRLTPGRPLLIVDAEGVLLKFVDGFDAFLRQKGFFLDLTSYRLHGNIRRIANRRPLHDFKVNALLHEFHCTCDALDAVDESLATLSRLQSNLDVVVLTNITQGQAIARRRNLTALGLDLPLVANDGLKGVAVKALAARAGRPSFFIDDIPGNLASAATSAPDITRIHLIGDPRLKGLLHAAEEANLCATDWREVETFIRARLREAGITSDAVDA